MQAVDRLFALLARATATRPAAPVPAERGPVELLPHQRTEVSGGRAGSTPTGAVVALLPKGGW